VSQRTVIVVYVPAVTSTSCGWHDMAFGEVAVTV